MPRAVHEQRHAGIVGGIEESDAHPVGRMQAPAVHNVAYEHFEEYAVGRDTDAMLWTPRQITQRFPGALLEVGKIFLVRKPVIVIMERKIQLFADAADLGIVGRFADNFRRVAPLSEERGIHYRTAQMLGYNVRGLARAFIGACIDFADMERFQERASALGLVDA